MSSNLKRYKEYDSNIQGNKDAYLCRNKQLKLNPEGIKVNADGFDTDKTNLNSEHPRVRFSQKSWSTSAKTFCDLITNDFILLLSWTVTVQQILDRNRNCKFLRSTWILLSRMVTSSTSSDLSAYSRSNYFDFRETSLTLWLLVFNYVRLGR